MDQEQELKIAGYAPQEQRRNIHVEVLNSTDFHQEVSMSVQEALGVLRDLSSHATKEMVQLKAAAKILDYALELNSTLNGEARNPRQQTAIFISDSVEARAQLRLAADQMTKIIGGR